MKRKGIVCFALAAVLLLGTGGALARGGRGRGICAGRWECTQKAVETGRGCGQTFVDENGDGICDYRQADPWAQRGCGYYCGR